VDNAVAFVDAAPKRAAARPGIKVTRGTQAFLPNTWPRYRRVWYVVQHDL
jgi:hypothetical protein